MKSWLGIAAVTALLVACTLLPFLPGPFDGLAVSLSTLAQVMGTAGLVLVPPGALWLAAERSRRWAGACRAFRLLALGTSFLVGAVLVLTAVFDSGFVLGGLLLALAVLGGRRIEPKAERPGGAPAESAAALPLFLVVVPLAVALAQLVLVDRAVTGSRDRAIRNSAPLIAAIESYRAREGRYPVSLLAVHPDIKTGVIGVERYHYEPHGAAYNLFFEQLTYRFGTREFVVYNPRDEHAMTSHALDLLELSPEQLAIERTRGHYALHATSHPHWRYYWFD